MYQNSTNTLRIEMLKNVSKIQRYTGTNDVQVKFFDGSTIDAPGAWVKTSGAIGGNVAYITSADGQNSSWITIVSGVDAGFDAVAIPKDSILHTSIDPVLKNGEFTMPGGVVVTLNTTSGIGAFQ